MSPEQGTWFDHEAGEGGGVIGLVQHVQRLDREGAVGWLRERGYLSGAARPSARPSPAWRPTRRATAGAGAGTLAYARRLWEASEPVPAGPAQPARRWLANRRLWWPELPCPPAVRWLNANRAGWREHLGAGAVVALLAHPEAWTRAWPELPELAALACVHISAEGSPALDRPEPKGGVAKRTYGAARGALTLLGGADPALAPGLAIAEGLADALALASRGQESAAATLTTPHGLPALAGWLSRWNTIRLYADNDGPGRRAAENARTRLRGQGVHVSALTVAAPGKDAAAALPLPDPETSAARARADQLTAEGLPAWEAQRLARTEPPRR